MCSRCETSRTIARLLRRTRMAALKPGKGRLMTRAFGALVGIFAIFLLVGGAPAAQAQDLSQPMVLVATPNLHGPYMQTALLVVPLGDKHIGFILNRATDVALAKAFPEHPPSAKVVDPIYFGGPEASEAIFALLRRDPGGPSIRLVGDLFMTGNGLTAKGSGELSEARTSLPAPELEVLVLIDGHSTVAQIVRSARGAAREAVLETIGKLRDAGLVRVTSESPYGAIDAGDFFSARTAAGSTPGDDAEAAAGVSSLQHKGYYVRIARRAGDAPARAEGRKLSVLVIEADPDLAKLVGTYLRLEDFAPRAAGNREAILAELRKPAPLDLVLLDVQLPDANGFDVLASMRRHPRFKSVPVIMLTSWATREAVLKGLRCG